jgi:hypothetical protein
MTRISTIDVLSGALSLLAVAMTSSAHAIEIKTPKVTMPHVNLPPPKTPQLNAHLNTQGGTGGSNTSARQSQPVTNPDQRFEQTFSNILKQDANTRGSITGNLK